MLCTRPSYLIVSKSSTENWMNHLANRVEVRFNASAYPNVLPLDESAIRFGLHEPISHFGSRVVATEQMASKSEKETNMLFVFV